MGLNGYPLRQDHGVGLLGTDYAGTPSITWATGPNGPVSSGSVGAQPAGLASSPPPRRARKNLPSPKDEPAAFYSQTASISNADDVVVAGSGQGSELLKGFLDNTIIFKIVKDNL